MRSIEAPSIRRQWLFFAAAVVVAASIAGVLMVLHGAGTSLRTRQLTTAVGLPVCGFLAVVATIPRLRWSRGRRRRAWSLLVAAGVVAILGNVVVAAGDLIFDLPPLRGVGDLTVAIALLLSILALINFQPWRARGPDLVVILLDGLVMGTAALLVVSTLVWPEILDSADTTTSLTSLLIPMLDLALVTVALLLLRRSGGPDRLALALVAAGFLSYAATDLAYAALLARGSFEFGTPLDLGWMLGYLLIALAPWYPSTGSQNQVDGAEQADDEWHTLLVFAVLLVAVLVEVVAGTGAPLTAVRTVLWTVLIAAAGTRQLLISRDNRRLRTGLEQQVRERTADLRQMSRENEVLLTSVADGIYGVDLSGRITFVNPSGAALLGYTVEGLRGQRAHDLFHAPREDGTPYPFHECYVAEAVGARLVVSSEDDLYVRADGELLPVEITASPIVDDLTREVRGGVVVFRDVTERREIDRMKNEFLSVVSHELRTPLTSIQGSLGLLAGGALGELPEAAGSMARLALSSSERLARMINDILDLERIESGSMSYRIGPRRASDLLATAGEEMAGMGEATGVHLEMGRVSGWVQADADRVVQVLTNVIGNAMKFSAPGSVVRCEAFPDHGMVLFRVRDEGRGIPADRVETIFERFEQVDSSDARVHGGSGLGLAICRGIVERHSGRIWAESEVDVGTTVSFVLPGAVRVASQQTPPPVSTAHETETNIPSVR